MGSLEQRVDKLEQHREVTGAGSHVTGVHIFGPGEARPTADEIRQAEEAYDARFPGCKSVGIMSFMKGVVQANGVEICRYHYVPKAEGAPGTFKEVKAYTDHEISSN